MSTYKTHFVIENCTDMPVIKGIVDFNIYDYDGKATPESIFSVVSSSRPYNSGGRYYKNVAGAISIPVNGRSVTELQLFENIGNNSRFTLTLEFSDGAQVQFDVYVRLAYETKKINTVANFPSGLDSFTVSQFSIYKDSHYSGSWGSNTYRLNQNVVPIAPADWMSYMNDATPLCDINIPGTHDSAAINTSTTTPYACQGMSITNQLLSGIRALDVRLKVKGTDPNFKFVTCHGDFNMGIEPLNEYQSFDSLLNECKDFLASHGDEALVMSLKIDDWNGQTNKAGIYSRLTTLLGQYPIFTPSTNQKSNMPILKDARGKLFLVNRINTQLGLGAPLRISNNMVGYASNSYRNFKIYVQDQYEFDTNQQQNTQDKLNLTTSAFAAKQDGEVVWNFGSGVYKMTQSADRLFGVYIHKELLNWFGTNDAPNRAKKLGWCFMDFAANEYESNQGSISFVDILISSNFNYENHPKQFSV
ncbi:MAG TPA: phosphatidylinositol-specific phospholipase C domain-containing protein [Blastocatellia bacterium]|nr:phosphatidylinositol-specific phospholipase C domain-containing protein [Blastocatellia bacterium]